MQTLMNGLIWVVGFGIIYILWIRPWQLHWGASCEEVVTALPGDEIVAKPSFNATRGVTVNARSQEIWPWLVQISNTRAGWYSYDCLDNLCKPSAEEILPELQNLKAGDLIPLSPDGKQGFWVKELHPGQWMLWWDKQGQSSWLWSLNAVDGEHTRLITRVRLHYTWLSPSILFSLLVEFTDIVMMRKCMLGIQQRAEKLARQRRQGQVEDHNLSENIDRPTASHSTVL